MSLLKVSNLSKSFNGFKALSDVAFTVNKHEVYGFIGRNGAGKTTTISILLSLLNKDEGTIVFDGETIDFARVDYKKKIGFVPDVPMFPNYLTGYEYLKLTADFCEIPKEAQKEKIEETLEFVKLPHPTRRIGGYSRGMKQRLAIASALLNDPILLIMDEPTSALDPVGRMEVLDMIRALKAKTTIFYSTHILEDAEKVCDRIGLIEQGKIMFDLPIKDVLSDRDTTRYYLEADMAVEELVALLKRELSIHHVKLKKSGVSFMLDENVSREKLLNFVRDHVKNFDVLSKDTASLEDVFVEVLNENNR